MEEHPYVHLMDGVLADNLGLRAVCDLYVREDIRAKINNGKSSVCQHLLTYRRSSVDKLIDVGGKLGKHAGRTS